MDAIEAGLTNAYAEQLETALENMDAVHTALSKLVMAVPSGVSEDEWERAKYVVFQLITARRAAKTALLMLGARD